MKPIRNSAKAVIVRDGKVLLTKNKGLSGFFYLFPGGGQEKDEVLSDTVVRECLEEIGCRVVVGDLLHVREYIGSSDPLSEWGDVHQVEFYFRCELAVRGQEEDAAERFAGSNPDGCQVDVEWVELSRLKAIRLYPERLGEMLGAGTSTPCYIGAVN